ncbi:MAG TPA: TadE family protein [Bryobacterales bacterium]|nr:TadE family protein [Bryobacterales bacterium]
MPNFEKQPRPARAAARPLSLRDRLRGRRGATMVEFALSWVLFFVITVVGVMDFGRAIWAYNLVAHGARHGARFAMVRGAGSNTPATASTIEASVRAQSFMLDQSKLTVTTTWLDAAKRGTEVEVRVLYSFVPALGIFQPGAVSLGSRSRKTIAN